MDTQKGAHGCATTQPPFLQTPQLPGTATARPEVTRLLPTMHLPPSVFPSFHPLSVSLSVRPSIPLFVPVRFLPTRYSASPFVSLLSLARCSTPVFLPSPFDSNTPVIYMRARGTWTRRDERFFRAERRRRRDLFWKDDEIFLENLQDWRKEGIYYYAICGM